MAPDPNGQLRSRGTVAKLGCLILKKSVSCKSPSLCYLRPILPGPKVSGPGVAPAASTCACNCSSFSVSSCSGTKLNWHSTWKTSSSNRVLQGWFGGNSGFGTGAPTKYGNLMKIVGWTWKKRWCWSDLETTINLPHMSAGPQLQVFSSRPFHPMPTSSTRRRSQEAKELTPW